MDDPYSIRNTVVPVLDLKGEQVVAALRGERENYRPVRSLLTDETDPPSVASAIMAATDCRTFYLADLDSLERGLPPASKWYHALLELEVEWWLDGCWLGHHSEIPEPVALELLNKGVRPIVSSECFRGLNELAAACRQLAGYRPIFGLDLKAGVPQFLHGAATESVFELVAAIVDHGIQKLILLDLKSVGSGQGPATAPQVSWLHDRFPSLSIVSGGGVRGLADVHTLLSAGCQQVLVATAIHQGRLP